jgi:DNA-binding MarR family transcriptional regulator
MRSKPLTNIPFLLNTVLAGLNNLSARDLTRLGVKAQAARALIILLQQSQLRCSVLSRMLGLEATALSHLLRSLARKQFIARNRVENDNRAVEVRLTDKGRRIAKKCHDVTRTHEHRMLQGLDAQDLQALQKILAKMNDNVVPPERRIRVIAKSRKVSHDAASIERTKRLSTPRVRIYT